MSDEGIDRLRGRIAEYFEIDQDVPVNTPLVERLGFDSIQMIELVDLIEQEAGLQAGQTPVEYPLLLTLEDCMDYFVELVATTKDHQRP